MFAHPQPESLQLSYGSSVTTASAAGRSASDVVAGRFAGARTVPVVLFVLLAIVFIATADYDHPSNDVYSADVAAWRIASAGTTSLDGVDTNALPHTALGRVWLTHGRDGHLVVSRSPGVQVAAVPAYWLTHPSDDVSGFSLGPACVTAALMTAAAVVLIGAALRRLVGTTLGYAAALSFGLATPVWTVNADGMWTHTITVLGICGMAWAAGRDRWWLVGLFGGIGIWGRLHVAVIVALLALGVGLWRRRPGIVVATALPSAALTALAALYSHLVYGSWVPSGGYEAGPLQHAVATGSITATVVNQLGLLVSPGRGMLVWTPAILVLVPAVVRSWRSAPDWTRMLAVGGIVYLVVQGQLDGYTGGVWFYGYRLALETLACVVPLLALSAPSMRRRGRCLLLVVIGAQFGVMTYGALSQGAPVALGALWHDNDFARAVHDDPARILLPLAGVLVVLGLAAATRHTHSAIRARPSSAPRS